MLIDADDVAAPGMQRCGEMARPASHIQNLRAIRHFIESGGMSAGEIELSQIMLVFTARVDIEIPSIDEPIVL